MVQNKKIGAGLALIAGLMGMCASEAALAMPEMIVGSRPGIAAQALSVESDDAAVTEETDTTASDVDAPSTYN